MTPRLRSLLHRLNQALFLGVFAYVTYGLIRDLGEYLLETAHGKGFKGELLDAVHTHEYYKAALAVIVLAFSTLTLWEIASFLAGALRRQRSRLLNTAMIEYEPTFLTGLLLSFLPKFIVIDVFWHWQPTFARLALFKVDHGWYAWIYALVIWELSTWVWHFGAHRIRLFWCLHSPHHAPTNFNLTVAWVHFFGEGYYTAVVQLTILMLLGVSAAMLPIIMSFEALWGTLIHAGERSFRTGRFGWLRFFIITPSYHRVHHGRNPLYMDTNFCTMLPVWDWIFGTLQPLRDEVRLEYGITRPLDPTNFLDFYFGEFRCLFQDLRSAPTWRVRALLLIKAPGWSPHGLEHTASHERGAFLATHPQLVPAGGPDVLARIGRLIGRAPATAQLLLLVCASLLLTPSVSQSKELGAVSSYSRTAHGIAGDVSGTHFSVDVYNANVIRLRVTGQESVQHVAYALADQEIPTFTGFNVDPRVNEVVLSTNAIRAVVTLRPRFHVRFEAADHAVLNEDVDGRELGITFIGNKVTVYKALQPDERFVGLGEELGDLDRRGTVVTLKNTDNYRYDDPKVPMYTSIPFFMGLHHNRVYGLFYNNSYRSVFNFGASNKRFASYSFDGGDLDQFFIHDATVGQILEHYTALTGRMPLPPKWALGYQQSRASYYPAEKVLFIARTFRSKHLPLDGIVLDADYLQGYEPFRINTQRFPDMKGLTAALAAMNIRVTASVNPGITLDESYSAHHSGLSNDVFLRFADGELYSADIAPNINHFPDFTKPSARTWWSNEMRIYPQLGIQGVWNDMNEPAIDGQAMPDNVVFNFDGHPSGALEGQNLYGFLMARASYESLLAYGGNQRPFVLSRAGFAGIQRYAAVWSGDNQARDGHIPLGVLLTSQMGLSGVPFTGPDLGGYIGDGNKDLFRRWIEVGVFAPYLRNHREGLAAANEPWAYGEEAEAIAQSYLGLRYQLLPYLYSVFYASSRSGIPVSRSLAIGYPFESQVYDKRYQYEFTFGDAILVNPMTSQETDKTTWLPPGAWFDIFNDRPIAGGREFTADYAGYKIPIFVKASAIIPMQKRVESMVQDAGDTLSVHVFYGTEPSSFDYYDDDGKSFDYRQGAFIQRTIRFEPASHRLVFEAPTGSYPSPFRKIRLILHGFPDHSSWMVNQQASTPTRAEERLIDPLRELQDVYWDQSIIRGYRASDTGPATDTLTFDNAARIVVEWRSP